MVSSNFPNVHDIEIINKSQFATGIFMAGSWNGLFCNCAIMLAAPIFQA